MSKSAGLICLAHLFASIDDVLVAAGCARLDQHKHTLGAVPQILDDLLPLPIA